VDEGIRTTEGGWLGRWAEAWVRDSHNCREPAATRAGDEVAGPISITTPVSSGNRLTRRAVG
jgi:hypothetical protein